MNTFALPYLHLGDFANDPRRLVHLIPYATENGYLSVDVKKSFCISANSQNKDLAWEFMKYMMEPENDKNLSSGGNREDYIYYYRAMRLWGVPTYKPLMDNVIEVVSPWQFRHYNGYVASNDIVLIGTVPRQIEIIQNKMRAITDMPVFYAPLVNNTHFGSGIYETIGYVPQMNDRIEAILQILNEYLELFQHSQISAEYAAEQIQGKVSEVLAGSGR
jgi:hypothetical protein